MAGSGRHLARRCASQALYQWIVTGQRSSEIEGSFIRNERLKGKHLEFFHYLIQQIPEKVEELDSRIVPHLDRAIEKVEKAMQRRRAQKKRAA